MNAAPYFFFLFFLIANVIALPGVRETYCFIMDPRNCESKCTCDYEGCEWIRRMYILTGNSVSVKCERTYECGTC